MELGWLIGGTCIVVSTALWTVELIPQLRRTLKTKSVDDISPWWLGMCFTAFIIYEIGMVLHENWLIFYTHLVPTCFTGFMLSLILRYKKVSPPGNVVNEVVSAIKEVAVELSKTFFLR